MSHFTELSNLVESECIRQSYVKKEKLRILALTFNVNARIESNSQEIEKMLKFSNSKANEKRPEIVIIALQEVVELSATNVVGATVLGNIVENFMLWVTLFREALNNGTNERNYRNGFVPYTEKPYILQMVGTAAIMFILESHKDIVRNVQMASVPRGMGNVLGNKGGVCIRCDINDTSICFVTAHLSAHRENIKKRNDDYYAIITAKIFKQYDYEKLVKYNLPRLNDISKDIKSIRSRLPATVTSKLPLISDDLENLSTFSPDEHDVIIWLGDLNYRIIEEMPAEDVYRMIFDYQFDKLSEFDQLKLAIRHGEAFECFNEAKLDFPPTYKYKPDSDSYDRPDESDPDGAKESKARCPAWCDRILWRLGKNIEKMKSTIMNQINDGSAATDMMFEPYPSMLQYLSPDLLEAVQNSSLLATTNLKKKASFISMNNAKEMKGSERANLNSLRTLDELRVFLNRFYSTTSIETITSLAMEACTSTLSDHKPIKALLELETKLVDYSQREQCLVETLHQYLHSTDAIPSLNDQQYFSVNPYVYGLAYDNALSHPNSGASGPNVLSPFNSITPSSMQTFSRNQPVQPVQRPMTSIIPKLLSLDSPLQKSLLVGQCSPIYVNPTALIITPALSKGLHHITLSNLEDTPVLDFLVNEPILPPWIEITPMQGRLYPHKSINIMIEFKPEIFTELSIDKNQNLQGLIVLQYVNADFDLEVPNYVAQRKKFVKNFEYYVDKLLIPVAYEVYHEV